MRVHHALLLLLLGILMAVLMAVAPHQRALAKTCYNINNQPIPCPDYKNPTKPPPPTATFTATSTSVPTATFTETAKIFAPVAVLQGTSDDEPPSYSSGFACPPYVGGIPLGVGILVLGAGLAAVLDRYNFPGSYAGRFDGVGKGNPSGPPSVTQTATVMGGGREEQRSNLMNHRNGQLNKNVLPHNNTGAGLPSMNQPAGAAGLGRWIGSGLAGLGAGLLGAGLLGSLLGLECSTATGVLPAGALIGLIGAIISSFLLRPMPPPHNDNNVYSTFERIGSIDTAGGTTGSSGLYKDQPLE